MHKGKIMLKKTDVVYLSGPMSDLPDCNIPAFYAAEKILRNTYGCEVLNPARQPKGLSYCEYMRRALNDLEWATAVVVLPRALESIGAGFEIADSNQMFTAASRIRTATAAVQSGRFLKTTSSPHSIPGQPPMADSNLQSAYI